MKYLRGFGQFWYDFVIGDDWKIAVAVVTALAVGAVLMFSDVLPASLLPPVIAGLVIGAFTVSMLIDVRSTKDR